MTSLGQWFGGGRRGDYDPWFGSELWDPSGLGANIGQDKYRGEETTALANAQVDWRENDDAHVFHVDLPGVRKEEVKVQVEDGNVLQISGERTKEQKDLNDKWHRVERRRGSFVRRFRLPENAHLDDIKCSLDHGVLTVTVPKKPMDQTSRNVRYIDVA